MGECLLSPFRDARKAAKASTDALVSRARAPKIGERTTFSITDPREHIESDTTERCSRPRGDPMSFAAAPGFILCLAGTENGDQAKERRCRTIRDVTGES